MYPIFQIGLPSGKPAMRLKVFRIGLTLDECVDQLGANNCADTEKYCTKNDTKRLTTLSNPCAIISSFPRPRVGEEMKEREYHHPHRCHKKLCLCEPCLAARRGNRPRIVHRCLGEDPPITPLPHGERVGRGGTFAHAVILNERSIVKNLNAPQIAESPFGVLSWDILSDFYLLAHLDDITKYSTKNDTKRLTPSRTPVL